MYYIYLYMMSDIVSYHLCILFVHVHNQSKVERYRQGSGSEQTARVFTLLKHI